MHKPFPPPPIFAYHCCTSSSLTHLFACSARHKLKPQSDPFALSSPCASPSLLVARLSQPPSNSHRLCAVARLVPNSHQRVASHKYSVSPCSLAALNYASTPFNAVSSDSAIPAPAPSPEILAVPTPSELSVGRLWAQTESAHAIADDRSSTDIARHVLDPQVRLTRPSCAGLGRLVHNPRIYISSTLPN